MHPYLAEQVASAHRDDLRRAALATCCANLIARLPLRDRLSAFTDRLTTARDNSAVRGTVSACCSA